MLYFIAFTYLFSLRKYDRLHDEVKKEEAKKVEVNKQEVK